MFEGRNMSEEERIRAYREEIDLNNPYLKKEGETYKERMKRLNLTKNLLRRDVFKAVGVEKGKMTRAFNKGRGIEK